MTFRGFPQVKLEHCQKLTNTEHLQVSSEEIRTLWQEKLHQLILNIPWTYVVYRCVLSMCAMCKDLNVQTVIGYTVFVLL